MDNNSRIGRVPGDNTKRLDCVKYLIKAARSNKFSTLRKLSAHDEDVFNIWDNVSQLIEYHMTQQKAVHIPGLGSFTFTTSKLDVGHNKFILIQRPVFVLSEKLARTHRLTQSRYHVPGEIPVIQLNFTALSYVLNLDRDLVESSIKEVVNALSHNIEQCRSCEFAFTTIGNLVITNGNAKMKFLPTFLEKMGQRGGMVSLLDKLPDASNSVLSDKSIVLPKIQPGMDIKVSSPRNVSREGTSRESVLHEAKDDLDDLSTRGMISPRLTVSPKRDTPIRETPLRESSRELISPTIKVVANSIPPSPQKTKRSTVRNVVVRDPRSECGRRQCTEIPAQPKPSKASLVNLSTNKLTLTSPKRSLIRSIKQKEESCDNCTETMNDFCYLCFQREARNIPICFNAERKREEEDEDMILQAYSLMRDKDALQQEQEKKKSRRKEAQEIAAFNLNAAEDINKKVVGPAKFERSYVFHNRPVTPPHYIKQDNYQDDLAQQVSEKRKREVLLKRGNANIERVEQLKLAEELAAQWESYLENKATKSENYRKALDNQVYRKKLIDEEMELAHREGRHSFSIPRPNVVLPFQKNVRVSSDGSNMMAYRSSELPAAYSDSDGPIFGVYDTDDKKRSDRRKKAQCLYQNQVEMAAKKRELSIRRSANLKKEEEEMLQKTKKELLEETLVRNSLNLQQRKELEKTWAVHDMKKKAKELEEKLRDRSPGLLLQEQCDKYDSCNQCTRKPTNYGRSNVWSESRYVSGSRLMV